ncbi:MAG: LPS export ABC transporter permease LptF [Chromatiales bacterium]|nr:LPS export ABC transporter permease LptF [Chromatiales bacterium]
MRLIIDRYLMREITLTFLAVSLLLVVMLLSSNFIRLATEVLEGDYPVGAFLMLFALKGVGNIVFILPFAFFFSILLAFTRLYKDNEIVVLMACGGGARRLFAGVLMLSLLVAVVVAYLSLFFAPWVAELSKQMLDEAAAKQEIEGIIPGRFNSLGSDNVVIYVEGYESAKKELRGLFIRGEQGEGESRTRYTINASRAYEKTEPNGERYLVLQDGYRYEGVEGQSDYQIIKFDEHGIRIKERSVKASRRPFYALPSADLWRSDHPSHLAELHWRISVPVSALLLALLAVPLSKTSPRSGRYRGLFVGILVYVVYNNLLTVGHSALGKGEVPPELGLWWVHLLAIMLLLFLSWKQQMWPRRREVRQGAE